MILAFGISACSLPVSPNGETGNTRAENQTSDCGTIVMLRPADVKEGFSRDLDCGQRNDLNTSSGKECFQYTVLLDHGGSFMVAQPEVPSLSLGKRVCIVPGMSGSTGILSAE